MKLKINKQIILLFAGLGFVLWQLLLPGYILTLDMVWGENLNFIKESVVNLLPFNYLLYFLNFILPSWIIQKIFLLAIFFCLFYLPHRFFLWPENKVARLWFSIFFVFNPFVYERFLAGHWSILLAYAFLVPFIYYLLKSNSKCLIWLILIGLFSLHLLAISLFILFVYLMIKLTGYIKRTERLKLSKSILIPPLILIGVLFIGILWFNFSNNKLLFFDISHWETFKTSSFSILGSLPKVIMLYGFWAESQPWANYFIWPKMYVALPFFLAIVTLIFLGIKAAFKNFKKENIIFFLFLLLASIVFSTGVGESIFKNFNLWLVEHIPFWSGFRDTTKWNSLIALIYGLFSALGAGYVIEKLKPEKYKNFVLQVILLLPLIYAYPMLGGFSRQIKPVWYPESWQEANLVLKKDRDCQAVFLPWHLYFSLGFNQNKITANPAHVFFDCQIFYSRDMELENAKSPIEESKYEKLSQIIKDDNLANAEANAESLYKLGIKYVISAKDLVGHDIFDYNFLKSAKLQPILERNDLILYSISQ